LRFFAVFADLLKSAAVGLPLAPAGFMRSPDPAFIRARFLWMLAYKPAGFFFIWSAP
jgi:hypothetical protein